MSNEKIYRSSSDYVVAGVCGGLAEQFKIDSSIVRLIFIILTLGGGSGLLIYLILWAVLPKNETTKNEDKTKPITQSKIELNQKVNDRGSLLGLIVVIIGLVALWNQILPDAIRWDLFWPIILIFIGLFLIFRKK